ncbi:hypothetical protein DS742_18700 [Lacrimispora amygdalina]|uniref:Uncharacterized protein n=1 Tax=Lacrimispora amygdalina TaxID=253257 RepID=A0A3E2N8Q4_9FIRM|nr:hypothetical protein [Clostridium indicum]RFZ77376.1 hypothetical protein DS742_18700 [Clostridium indicum]
MLEFLQTGKALYVLAVLCGIGIITRWLTRNLYKRLIKESDNLTLTKNRNLRAFKQKTESTYQMNQGIPRVKPYLERQMYDFKHMGITLHGWNMFSNQMTLWCFLAGGAAAFGSYWYRTDPYYIVLYGSVGIMAGLFTILVDHGAGITEKRQQLFAALDNYLENTLIYRLDQEREESASMSGPRLELRENIRSIYGAQSRSGAEPEAEPDRKADRRSARQRVRNRPQKQAEEYSDEIEHVTMRGESMEASEAKGSVRDVDYLKKSLEQIAASREKERGNRQGEDWLKDLNPDELKLIGEILQEYLT